MTDLATLEHQVRAARSAVDREVGEALAIAQAGKRAQARVQVLAGELELHEQVIGVLTRIGEARQESAQQQIEELVTRGLQVIFGEDMTFHLVQSVKANAAQVDFVVRSTYTADDVEARGADAPVVVETPVMDARGGGLAAVVGFMLRLVVLLLTPGARRILFLDETFAHVSAEYEPRLAEFLREVAEKAGVQLFLVTHSDAYSDLADQRYQLALGSDGSTRIREA